MKMGMIMRSLIKCGDIDLEKSPTPRESYGAMREFASDHLPS